MSTGAGTAANLPRIEVGRVLFAKMALQSMPTGAALPPLLSGALTAAALLSRAGQLTRTAIGGVLAGGVIPAFIAIEGLSVNADLNSLQRDLNVKRISEKKYAEIVKKRLVTGAGNVTGTATGIVVGQALIPVPFVGAAVGSVVGGIMGRLCGNVLGNLAFDKNGADGADYGEESDEDSEEGLEGGGY